MRNVFPRRCGTLGSLSGQFSYLCGAGRWSARMLCIETLNSYGQCDVQADSGPVLAVPAGNFHTCAVRADVLGSVTCQQIWNQFGQSQRAMFTLAQCG